MVEEKRDRRSQIRTLEALVLLLFIMLLFPLPASAADTTPPSQVADLAAVPDAVEAKITLTWTAATDDVEVAYYVLVRDITGPPLTGDSGILIPLEPRDPGDDNSGTFVYTRDDYDVIRGETIWYAVFAVDPSGNSAPLSNVATTTPLGETFPHGGYTDLSGLCRTCHEIHQSQSQRMIFRRAPEIEICYTCHDGTGSDYDIRNYAGFEGLASHEQLLAPPARTNIVCDHCHTPHGATDQDFLVRGTNPEEVLCRNCHKIGTTLSMNGWDIDAQFNKASYHALTGTTGDGLIGAKVECTSCHGPHTAQQGPAGSAYAIRVSDPLNTWKLWQDNGRVAVTYTNFCLECHKSGALPVATWNDPVTFVPFSIAFPAVSAPFFTGWDKTPFRDTNSIHFVFGADCQSCHHPHASDNQRLKAWSYRADNPADPDYSYHDDAAAQAKEENLCYQCHDPTPPGDFPSAPDIESEFAKAYKMPIANADLHSDTEDDVGVGVPNRHSECADCHDPHEAKAGTRAAGSNDAGPPIVGIFGVAVVNGASGTDPSYTPGQITKEYELCFKCHSGYTTQPAGQSNKALEFNPNNDSYHPVEAIGKNQGSQLNQNLQGGLDTTSLISCTDCHNNNATNNALGWVANSASRPKGPHGSTYASILRHNYFTDVPPNDVDDVPGIRTQAEFALCFLCHNTDGIMNKDAPSGFGTSHEKHINSRDMTCKECHYNVHSSVEANNTLYLPECDNNGKVGDGTKSHLMSFPPGFTGTDQPQPCYEHYPVGHPDYPNGGGYCAVRCHGSNMSRDYAPN